MVPGTVSEVRAAGRLEEALAGLIDLDRPSHGVLGADGAPREPPSLLRRLKPQSPFEK